MSGEEGEQKMSERELESREHNGEHATPWEQANCPMWMALEPESPLHDSKG